MASISFPLSNHVIGRQSSAASSQRRHQFRLSAGCATARNAPQTSSLYEVLGVRAGSTSHEIKSAYRKLARVSHPDGRGDVTSATDEFIRLQAAYDTLSDPVKRAVYDRTLFRLPSPLRSGCPELTRRARNWETDQCW